MVKAIAILTGGMGVEGTVYFNQEENDGLTTVKGKVSGLNLGLHGFHVNPASMENGAPEDEVPHVGELGNLTTGNDVKVFLLISMKWNENHKHGLH